MRIFGKSKPVELASLGDIGFLLERERGHSALSRLRSDNFEENATINKITNATKETIYFFETLTYAGINNTSSKLFGNWFDMDSPIEGESMNPRQKNDLIHFHLNIQLKSKMMCMANDAMAYGNGYLEMFGERGQQIPEEPLYPEDGLKDVVQLDPLYMAEKIIPITDDGSEFYYQHRRKDGTQFKIHNSRVLHVPWAKLGTMRFGRGVIEIGIRTMLAKISMDWSMGEIVYRYGKPFIVIKTTGATKPELQKAYEILKKLNPRTGFAGTERHTFDILNPSGLIKPEPFAKFYYINQARALEMPLTEFIGVQKGEVTGGETDTRGWYQTLKSKQETKFSDPISVINNQYLKGDWDGIINWNVIYFDDKAEWEINLNKVKTMDFMYRQGGYMTAEEARQWCRDNGVPFPEDDTLWEEEEEEPEEPEEPEYPELPFPQQLEEPEIYKKQIEKLRKDRIKDAEFLADQELFWQTRE